MSNSHTPRDIDAVARVLTEKYGGKLGANGELSCRCPFHDDEHRSASFDTKTGAFVCYVPTCRASGNHNITFKELAQTIGASILEAPPPRQTRRIVATYDYHDANGNLVQQVVRFEPKSFAQRVPSPDGKGWIWKSAKPQVPYNLPALIDALKKGRTVFVVEGEKHVDALGKLGFVATTCAMGAGKWTDEHTRYFVGSSSRVFVLPDNDEPGRLHAESVVSQLRAAGVSVHILDLPDLPPKGDVIDWLNALPKGTDAAATLKALCRAKATKNQSKSLPTVKNPVSLVESPESALPAPVSSDGATRSHQNGNASTDHRDTSQSKTGDGSLAEREVKVLASYLLLPDLYDEYPLTPQQFYTFAHQVIMRAFIQARAQGNATVASIVEVLRANRELEIAGGVSAIQSLLSKGVSKHEAELYIQQIAEEAFIRRLQHAASRLASIAAEPDLPLNERRASAERVFAELLKDDASRQTRLTEVTDLFVQFSTDVEKSYQGGVKQYRTGLPQLDRMVRLEPSRLVVVAARPGVGKSIFLLNLARGICAANQSARVAMYSLEMNANQILRRMVSAYGDIDTSRIGSDDMTENDWRLFYAALSNISKHSIHINDSAVLTVGDIKRECSALKRSKGLDAIVVDYLGLLQRPSNMNEAQALGRVARELKVLATSLGCVVIAAAQLNRTADQLASRSHLPDDAHLLASLRDSGEIEEHADIAIFLERPHRLNSQADPRELVVRVLKNRDGATGQLSLGINLARASVYERPSNMVVPTVKLVNGG